MTGACVRVCARKQTLPPGVAVSLVYPRDSTELPTEAQITRAISNMRVGAPPALFARTTVHACHPQPPLPHSPVPPDRCPAQPQLLCPAGPLRDAEVPLRPVSGGRAGRQARAPARGRKVRHRLSPPPPHAPAAARRGYQNLLPVGGFSTNYFVG